MEDKSIHLTQLYKYKYKKVNVVSLMYKYCWFTMFPDVGEINLKDLAEQVHKKTSFFFKYGHYWCYKYIFKISFLCISLPLIFIQFRFQ